MKRFAFLLPLVLLSLLTSVARSGAAQTPAMSLMGSVQSEERKPLAGAAVTVVHMPSGARYAAASDASGRFVIANLLVGGPYLIQVGEGGYRPQTVENIFLETGKTANFTVTLSKLGKTKARDLADNSANGTTLTLAKEAAVGGPVLLTTSTAPTSPAAAQAGARVASEASAAKAGAAHSTAGSSSGLSTGPAADLPGAVASATAVPTATAPRYKRYNRYPDRKPGTKVRVADPIVPGHFDAKSGNYIYETGQPTALKLANGSVITGVGINSTESYLYRFLANPSTLVDTLDLTQGWYNFDRVFFNPGKATLTPESIGQLRNIATILRAFPNACIKLGGYTDSTGTYKVNRQLSEARARTAWASLVEMGISPSRLDARGYGSNYAIAENNSDEGRAKNRRLSVKVLQK
ncbi:OmpA family protein [Hymenobacter rubidus]|uniref:OmpA family protein n=1 Tax=Hymenobacter rubidus TaxID=1441626 RepID=UPI00191E0E00|nr:OmpA family protein [Hymenobacter rubidus]